MEKRRFWSHLRHFGGPPWPEYMQYTFMEFAYMEEVDSWMENRWLHTRITWHDIVDALHMIGHHELAESILFH